MKTLLVLGPLALSFALCSCSSMLPPQAEITKLSDEFSRPGETAYGIVGNTLEKEKGGTSDLVEQGGIIYSRSVDLGAICAEAGESRIYSLHAHYGGPDWLFLEPGESLILLADGERVGLSGEGSVDHRSTHAGGVSESASFAVPPELLVKIAGAKEVKVKLQGSSGSIQRRFGKENLKIFGEFVRRFITREEPGQDK